MFYNFYNYLPGASLIEEQNFETNQYEKTQIEMVKNFLRSDDTSSRKLTITKIPPTNQPKLLRRGRPDHRSTQDGRRPRPHSMSALPSATNEADFTRLLADMMDEERGIVLNDDGHDNYHGANDSNARLVPSLAFIRKFSVLE